MLKTRSISRNFCYTHNNYADTVLQDKLDCKYIIYGKEVSASGTPHLQGFVSFKNEKSIKAVITLMPGCHVEVAKSPVEAIAYCKKGGDYSERGSFATPKEKGVGEKRRWDEIRIAAEEGRFDDIDDQVRFRDIKLIEHHRNLALRRRQLLDTDSNHLWYYGPTGTGKSRTARSEHPDPYLKIADSKWWAQPSETGESSSFVSILYLLGSADTVLSRMARAIAAEVLFPVNTAYLHGLGVIASLAVRRFKVAYWSDRNTIPVNLYVVTSQPSSSGRCVSSISIG